MLGRLVEREAVFCIDVWARLAVTFVLHTWGLTHHPHVHGIVPDGGLSLDGERRDAGAGLSFCLLFIQIKFP